MIDGWLDFLLATVVEDILITGGTNVVDQLPEAVNVKL